VTILRDFFRCPPFWERRQQLFPLNLLTHRFAHERLAPAPAHQRRDLAF
jgi:hypothetical protein